MKKTMNAEERHAIYAAMRELKKEQAEALSSGRFLVGEAIRAMPAETTFTASQISATVGLPHQSIAPNLRYNGALRREKRIITQRYAAINDDGSINLNRVINFAKEQTIYIKKSAHSQDVSSKNDEVKDILSQLNILL